MLSPSPTRVVFALGASALLPFLSTGCGGDGGGAGPVDPAVSLDRASASLFVGEQVTLVATVTGSTNAVSFSSSAPGVASVDASGTVTGVTPGTATITATVSGASASAQITVNPSTISVTPDGNSIFPDETLQLSATVAGGSGHTLTWTSNDIQVATVDGNGLVTAVGPGAATITASIDGQVGVEAAVVVNVLVPAPVVEFVSFEDQTGAPLDFENVTGVFVINTEISGYVGTEAVLELYFDGELFSSLPFTVEAPGVAFEGRGPPLRLVKTRGEVPLSVNSLAVEDIQNTGVVNLQELVANAPHLFSASTAQQGNSATVNIRGSGSSLTMTTNNPPVGLGRATHLGQTVVIDGRTFGNGDVRYDFGFTQAGIFDIDRIEVLRGPQGSLYGSNAEAGLANIIIPRDQHEGTEGETYIQDITAFDSGDNPQSVVIANNFPEIFDNIAGMQQYTYIDYAGPTAAFTPTYPGDLVIGAGTDFQDYVSLQLNYGINHFSDATGVSDFRWQVSTQSDTWDPEQDFRLGAEFQPTDGLTLYYSAYARDAFGQGTREIVGNGSGGFARLGVDLLSPMQSLAVGPTYLADLGQYNTPADWTLKLDVDDPVPQGFSWSSGVDRWRFRARWEGPGGVNFDFGDAQGLADIPYNLEVGWTFPFTSGAGEYTLDAETLDRGDNSSGIVSLRLTYDHTPPVLTAPTFTGLTNNQFASGTDIGVQLNATEDVENYFATAGAYAPSLGWSYIGPITPLGTPHDGTFVTNSDLDLTIPRYPVGIEFTGGPNFGTGWHPFTWAGAAVMNTAGGYSQSLLDVTSQLPPEGTPFGSAQLESWFTDQLSVEACLGTGPECNGRSQTITVSARGWVPIANGFPQYTEGQLYAMKWGPGGETMFQGVGDPIAVTYENFGGFGNEVQLSKTFNVVEEGLGEPYFAFFWGLNLPDGGIYATDKIAVSLRKDF